jgi:hypothetical protein
MNKERTRIQRVYRVLDESDYPYVGDSSRKEFQVDFRGQKLSISRIQTNVSDWDSMDAPKYSYNIVSGDRTFEKYHPQVPEILEFLKKKDFSTFKFDSGGRVYNDQELLEKYRKKQKIGFSAKSHLKAKGLIPRSDGSYRVSEKYEHGGPLNSSDSMESQNLSGQNMPGGYLVGNSHAEGGIKIKTPEGMIEAEGGETIINKRSMASDEVLICEGTPKEIASKINEYGDGVQFAEGGNCRVVSTGETVSSSTTTMDNNMAENGMQVTAAEGMRVASDMKKYTVTSLYDSDISWQADENDLQRYVIESMDEFDFKPGESLIESMSKMGFSVSTNVYFPDSAAEMAARGTIVRSTDASVRPSPSISATIFDVGTRMTGNDGNTWEIVEDSRGVHRWKRVKMEDGGVMMAADGIQTKPTQKEICFFLDEESDGSQLWAFVVNDDMDVNFRIQFENRDYDYDVPQWDYRSESTYFSTETGNADFASGFEMLEIFDKDGEPIEVSDEMKDELNKQIEKVYKSYFEDEAKDDIPRSIKGSVKFENGGPVNEFTMNVKSSLDALMKYFAEHDNKIHVHGSNYEYNSQTPMYLRVTGGKGATYNIVPFFSKIGSGIYEGAMYYSLVRAAVKKDFALLQSGKLMDLAEDGMEVKADRGLLTGSLGTSNDRRFQRELEMLRDDLKDEVITMDEYYQQRNELYKKYGIGKFARGGKVKKMYAILRSPMGEVIADVEVENEDKNEALKKFRDMGIQEIGSISFTNNPPYYYADGGDIEKANLGYLLVAEKIKGIAPKSFDAADEKVAERIKSQQYADGGDVKYGKPEFIDYKGESIMFEPINNEYYVNDEMFYSLEDAKKYIDAGSPLSEKMIDAYRHGLFEKGGSIDDKKVTAFVKSLEKSGLMAKGSHTNQRAIDTIKSIVSMSRTEFDEYITKNPNRNVNMIYNEYQDWVQTYAEGGGVGDKMKSPLQNRISTMASRISNFAILSEKMDDVFQNYTYQAVFDYTSEDGTTEKVDVDIYKFSNALVNDDDPEFDVDFSFDKSFQNKFTKEEFQAFEYALDSELADYEWKYGYADGGDVNSSELKEKYNQLADLLEKIKVSSRITLTDRDIIVELGTNYPDRLAEKVFDASDSIGLSSKLVNVSAESSGHTVLESKRTFGGPKRYFADGGDVKKKLNEPPSRVSGQKIVVFSKKVNPQVTITVKTYPNGQITDIENEYEVRFPYSVGQVLNMGHRTWACSNGYMVNDEDPCGEKKIFGMRASDIPPGHELRTLFPHKFRK